ncbi:hypothetical protein ACO2Q3_12525 [Caulobacter sp. KR2-114]|uniref:hypothetical protein n=1 Tax=Caulobacter sp. KR2-114 TaxID=3400912 RepID=UPI003C0CD151
MMACNARNHRSDCHCGWGGTRSPRPAQPSFFAVPPKPQSRAQRLRRLTIPDVRCPECRERVFFHQSVGGGRVYLDKLGPPWPRHLCTEHPDWNVRRLGEAGGGHIVRQRTPAEVRRCVRDARGWLPVTDMQPGAGRPADSFVHALAGGTVWIETQSDGIALLWFPAKPFDWGGPVFFRPRPKDPMIFDLETIRIARGAPRPIRLTAILDDPSVSGESLAGRLARAVG